MERLLLSCSKSKSTGYTSRKLIGFKRESDYKQCIEELAKYGIRPVKSIQKSRVICCHLDSRRTEQLKSLSKHPNVNFVEPDFKIHAHILQPVKRSKKSVRNKSAPYLRKRLRTKSVTISGRTKSSDSTTTPWNLSQIGANKVWSTTRGKGAGIAIIDTGIAKHSDLKVTGGVNTMGGSSYYDDNGHGTHVAGIAAGTGSYKRPGVAPRASLYAVKALDANGAGYVSDIIKGIDWCISKNIPIINMSLGLEGETSSALKEAVQRARKNGILIVASAGNNGTMGGRIDQPARYTDALAVAASTRYGKIANYSSRGYGIDVTAPGSYIKSTWPGGSYKSLSGTSMASPHVAGGAALLKSLHPSITPYGIAQRLRNTTKKLSSYAKRTQGYGLIQLADAMAVSEDTTAASSRVRSAKTKSSAARKTAVAAGKQRQVRGGKR
ncbi:S8 family peptidase [Paenibacillus taihuensis]|uniref:S8 family peptidase n=1 Tax=Paenibacillus taihuensis TaxID=1156355 RepID=UPI001FE84F64|nr:S8 family peptidase [Paenibacillus taihuensis]